MASSSVFGEHVAAAATRRQCIFAPPISSSVTFSPMTISAMRGEPRYMRRVAVDHDDDVAERGDVRAAGGADGPKSRQICGTTPDSWTWL